MLLEKYISEDPNATVLILFGGNPLRLDEVIQSLKTIQSLSVTGALSENEEIKAIQELPKVDLVLIVGRYSPEQRFRVKSVIAASYPHVKATEPGLDEKCATKSYKTKQNKGYICMG